MFIEGSVTDSPSTVRESPSDTQFQDIHNVSKTTVNRLIIYTPKKERAP